MIKNRHWPYKKHVFQALVDAEVKKQGPVYFIDIIKEWSNQRTYLLAIDNFTVLSILYDLYRDDQIMSDRQMTMFASYKVAPQFETYTLRMSRILDEGDSLDLRLRIIPNESSGRENLNFRLLKRMLVSPDSQLKTTTLKQYKRRAYDNDLHFLSGTCDLSGDRTVFTGYPKSGTSLLRKYLERPTGLFTGSDVNLLFSLPAQLQGRKGQGIVDDRVWFV